MADISVYDLSGRMVKTLLSKTLESGYHSIQFNASNLPSGMYFYKILVSGSGGKSLFSSIRKMILMK